MLTRKGALAIVAFVGLSAPLALSLMLGMDLNDEGSRQMGAVFGTLVVDKFSLFFKFLLVAVAALVILASAEYVDRFHRFRGEFFALVLLSTSGMMLLASTVELISIYVSLELTALPIAALAAFLRNGCHMLHAAMHVGVALRGQNTAPCVHTTGNKQKGKKDFQTLPKNFLY